jgi:hypothetical protein
MKNKPISLLKSSFIIGVIADAIVAINWFLISLGFSFANLVSAFRGSGVDYEFAMFICSLFMFGWTAILFWGFLKPEERKGLLLITSSLLLVSIILELILFYELLISEGFLMGIFLRIVLISKFSFSYFYSKYSSA